MMALRALKRSIEAGYNVTAPALYALAIMVSVACVCVIMHIGSEKRKCDVYETVTGRETKYVDTQCYHKINGVWFSQLEYYNLVTPQRSSILITQDKSHD